jgi:hypothetical protein
MGFSKSTALKWVKIRWLPVISYVVVGGFTAWFLQRCIPCAAMLNMILVQGIFGWIFLRKEKNEHEYNE